MHAVDLDGDIDIVIAGDDTGSGSFWDTRWWENRNALGTSWTAHDIGMAGGDKAVCTADLDNDQFLDILAMGLNGVRWWENQNDTDPWPFHNISGDYSSNVDIAYSLQAADS